jgi:hypothetical protein
MSLMSNTSFEHRLQYICFELHEDAIADTYRLQIYAFKL